MTKKIADFNEDLKRGHKGEELFEKYFPLNVKRLDGRQNDFITDAGTLIEIKTDFTDYNNIFFERWSNTNKGSNGGPWQALDKGNEYFIYVYARNKKYYVFNTKELVEFLNNYINQNKLKLKSVDNGLYITQGYAIPIFKLQSLGYFIEQDWLDLTPNKNSKPEEQMINGFDDTDKNNEKV